MGKVECPSVKIVRLKIIVPSKTRRATITIA